MSKNNSFLKSYRNILLFKNRYGYNKSIRVLFHYAYRITKKFFSNPLKNTKVRVNGYDLYVIPNDTGISSELLMFKTHEPLTTKLISQIIKKDMVCLDIGSNIGYYALLEHRLVGDEGKIISIEPSPYNYEFLKKNLEMAKAKNISSFNFAAGNKNGNTRFLIYAESNGCMTIPDDEEPQFPGKIVIVPIKKIDTFVDENRIDKIDFLRMDVEGYEYYIFEGMQKTLQTFKPLIQIEVHSSLMGKDNTSKFFKMLLDLGYETLYYIPRDVDVSIIGTNSDVKNYKISELQNMLNHGTLPSFFMLILRSIEH